MIQHLESKMMVIPADGGQPFQTDVDLYLTEYGTIGIRLKRDSEIKGYRFEVMSTEINRIPAEGVPAVDLAPLG
jgi:hypothetical protein